MSRFSQGFRSFLAGFDWELIRDYWRAVREHAWEIFWGSGVPGIIFTAYTLYYAPARAYIPWAVAWAILVAGYYIWRSDHVRLTPKFDVTKLIPQPTETNDPNEMSMFIQIVPECLSDAPVTGCSGRLLRVCRRNADDEEWTVTRMNAPMYLGWDYYGFEPRTLLPGVDQRLNICHWGSSSKFIIPSIHPIPSKVRVVFNSTGTFKFDIRITADECSPVDIAVIVRVDLAGDWDKPILKLVKGGHSVHEPPGTVRISEV